MDYTQGLLSTDYTQDAQARQLEEQRRKAMEAYAQMQSSSSSMPTPPMSPEFDMEGIGQGDPMTGITAAKQSLLPGKR